MMDKLLIVDDQSDIRKLLRITLGRRYELLEAEDATTAWEIIRHDRPRGIRADRAIKSTYVALVTARGQATDVERGKAVGADDYFIKPYSPIHLLRTIEKRLGGTA